MVQETRVSLKLKQVVHMVTTLLDIDFSFLQISQTGSGPPGPLFNGHRAPFLGLKLPGREANHSRPSSSEVKNEWITPLCLRGVDRDNFTLNLSQYFSVLLVCVMPI
jgi:hypothetical protein